MGRTTFTAGPETNLALLRQILKGRKIQKLIREGNKITIILRDKK